MSAVELDWTLPPPAPHSHGGADALGAARFDFSSNANAAGPLPSVATAVAAADRRGYPDPAYAALRQHLGRWHGVSAERIVPAASASEFIHRFTRAAALWGGASRVLLPRPGYGDYAAAAGKSGLVISSYDSLAAGLPGRELNRELSRELSRVSLAWVTEPISPSGATRLGDLPRFLDVARAAGASVVLDLAYQPLRFDGGLLPPAIDSAWQLYSPNKACGLTGVRAAYAIAPIGAEPVAAALRDEAASWVVGAEGVAMLTAFAGAKAQAELELQRRLLFTWRETLLRHLRERGWHDEASVSVTPFFLARPPPALDLGALRNRGIKLRDASELGLPGWVRMSAQGPEAVAALCRQLD